ncbi:MAG TPA: hypothetical protein VNA22_08125, partial [Pyrinomonadaceae bacterium]|nr:hypothetical protein [Pyrinomonadaceae bacterium]
SAAQGPAWHKRIMQIVPGTSSSSDVERLFNSSQLEKSFVDGAIGARFYTSTEGELSVYIATRVCTLGSSSRKVPQQTVIEATFFPAKEISLKKFGISKSKFKRTAEDDNPTIHPINSAAGLDYAMQNGRVIHVTVSMSGLGALELLGTPRSRGAKCL